MLYRWRIPVLPTVFNYVIRFVFGCWMPASVQAGKNLILGYGGLGIVIHGDTILGDNVHVDQQVTIGGTATAKGTPVIGSNVYLGAGSKILGPIRIGDNCVVGANAVVISDLPDGSVAVGVPARIIKSGIQVADFLYHLRSVDRVHP